LDVSSSATFQFHDEAALLERLSRGLKRHPKEVVFLVGSAISAPNVPGVHGVIDLIRKEFDGDTAQISALEAALASEPENRYQAAFFFLQGRRGQQTANEIVRRAVLAARCPPVTDDQLELVRDDEACRRLDLDGAGWVLSPAVEGLGRLIAHYPQRFGSAILTTNFDPLIQISIRRADGKFYRTTLHADGNLTQTEAEGCHVIHLHGYWYGSDTLHTHRQLGQPRPHLADSLGYLLRNKLVVVSGYGGWDDIFTEALMNVVRDETAFPEIIWTFYDREPMLGGHLSRRLEPGINRGRVTLYHGVDCQHVFPALYDLWAQLEGPAGTPAGSQSNPVRVDDALRSQIEGRDKDVAPVQAMVLEGANEDRPPVVEICVGRDRELEDIQGSAAKVIFVTGIGGQGKSTVAAQYFARCADEGSGFTILAWRDCKEESERFENQLASLAEKLSGGKVLGPELANQDAKTIIELLLNQIGDRRVLLVFDNVDHYVDLEKESLSGSANALIFALLDSPVRAQVVFTCRPNVRYDHSLVLSQRLDGLSLQATRELFQRRKASSSPTEIEGAHNATSGHAFWLDLLAIQVEKLAPTGGLRGLVREISSGTGQLPADTLKSIWSTLRQREQTVLRAMAETVKPETEAQIGDYLAPQLHYNKVVRALKALRALNLIVVKRRLDAPDLLELHPLVRQFVRNAFPANERISFIDAIIRAYILFRIRNRVQLSERPSISVLEHWTQNAELDVEAGRFADAFNTLAEAAGPFESSAYPREFCRATQLLLSKIPWTKDWSKYNSFDAVFMAYVRALSYLGEHSEADALLDQYEQTVPARDARYVRYCTERSHLNWVRGEPAPALEWARLGKRLKSASGADIAVDIEHQLALAERDSGQPEVALQTFLAGRTLSEVLDPDELEPERDGPHYGNIGRCLHFMGQIESALICYQKSALLIERRPRGAYLHNQGYIRTWVGELLTAREQYRLAGAFFRAAYLKWSQVSPPKAASVLAQVDQMRSRVLAGSWVSDEEVEKVFLDWILGRNVDSKYA
jgi:tetratricopeptide (TPR) repeat protein